MLAEIKSFSSEKLAEVGRNNESEKLAEIMKNNETS